MDSTIKNLKKFDVVQSKVHLTQRPNYQIQKPEIRLGVIVSDPFTAHLPLNRCEVNGDEEKPFDIANPESYYECNDMVLVNVYVPGFKGIEAVRLFNLSLFNPVTWSHLWVSYDEAAEITRSALGVKIYIAKIAEKLRSERDAIKE